MDVKKDVAVENSELSQIKRIAELIIKNDDSNLEEFVKEADARFIKDEEGGC